MDLSTATPHSNVKKLKSLYALIALHTIMGKNVSVVNYLPIGMNNRRNAKLAWMMDIMIPVKKSVKIVQKDLNLIKVNISASKFKLSLQLLNAPK